MVSITEQQKESSLRWFGRVKRLKEYISNGVLNLEVVDKQLYTHHCPFSNPSLTASQKL